MLMKTLKAHYQSIWFYLGYLIDFHIQMQTNTSNTTTYIVLSSAIQ